MKFILLSLLISCYSYIKSQTIVSGGLFQNTTWTLVNSPYIVTSDVALFPGFTLTIEPGVTIKFDNNTKLIIRGSLIANGTNTGNIFFISNSSSPTMGIWDGIQIDNSQGGKIIGSYINCTHASNFIEILGSSSGEILNLSKSNISYCSTAFQAYNASGNYTVKLDSINAHNNTIGYYYAENTTITNSTFSNGDKGISTSATNNYIQDCEFFNFTSWALYTGGIIDRCYIHDNIKGISLRPSLEVKNCDIELNTDGIAYQYSATIPNLSIHNNKICSNTYNFRHYQSYPIDITNNCWCNIDSSSIASSIYDAYDNPSYGIATFVPFLNNDCRFLTNINDEIAKLKFTYFPNPTEKTINIDLEEYLDDFSITILNIHGETIFQKKYLLEHFIKIDIDSPSGIYFAILNLKNEKFKSFKIIKK